jgi:S-formylglutathione hydrolase FrmB
MRFFFLGAAGLALLLLISTSCQEPVSVDNGERPAVGISIDSVVRRVAIPSQPMTKVFNAYVILPESYFLDTTARFYPVVYLLHGYSGDYADWYTKVPQLRQLATQHELIIVTPDGNYNSWYLDSPLDSTSRFFTYISQEVPTYVDANFRTRREASQRALVGLSMGGHGALHIGLQRPEIFGAIGSMSGVMDLRRHPKEWELGDHLGDPLVDSLRWQENSVLYAVQSAGSPASLFLDCGTDDVLIAENRALHDTLLMLGIPHFYSERPGGHDWDYWSQSVRYHLLHLEQWFNSEG